MNHGEPPHSECFVCQRRAVARCLRCEGRVCSQHAPAEQRRCFACEWLGYHLRWMWREVLISTVLAGASVLTLAFVVRESWVTYLLGIPLLLLLSRWRPLAFLDAYKRRLFLAERLPGLWYEHAIKLRSGKVKSRSGR